MLQGHKAVRALSCLTVLSDLLFKAILQPWLRRKSPHQGQTFNGFTKQTGQFTHFLLAAFCRAHHLSPEQADQPDDHRSQQKNGEAEFPVQPEHGAEHHEQLQQTGNRVVDCLVEHLAHTIGVLGEAVGEIPCRQLFQSTQLHTLQRAEKFATQALAHLESRPGQERVLTELRQLLNGKNQHPLPDQLHHTIQITGAESRKQLTGQLNQQRKTADVDQHAGPTQEQLTKVWAQQRYQSPEAGLRGFEHGGTVSMVLWCFAADEAGSVPQVERLGFHRWRSQATDPAG